MSDDVEIGSMFEEKLLERDGVLICRPTGLLDYELAGKLVSALEVREAESEAGFQRFADLTWVHRLNLSRTEVEALAERRSKHHSLAAPVRAAFWVDSALTFGIARMYEYLLQTEMIHVGVFWKLDEAADWVGVHPAKLRPEE